MTVECESCGNKLPKRGTRCTNCLTAYNSRVIEAIDRYYDASSVVNNSNSDTYRKRETFREKVQLLFPRLIELAADGIYRNQSAVIGDGIDVWALKHYLGAVSAIEHWDGRPLLTSVIINEQRGFPADGYFQLIERLNGLPDSITTCSEAEKREWWREELADVHHCWEGYDGSL